MTHTADAFIGLGANLGDRRRNLHLALERLRTLGAVFAVSSVYETEPWGVEEPQPAYLNQVCGLRTELSAAVLVNGLLRIEADLGRRRERRNEAREIDLDLLLYGDRIIRMPGLEVPHPRMSERGFVLVPLAEIAPDLIDPVTGATPVDLLTDVDASGVQRWTPPPEERI